MHKEETANSQNALYTEIESKNVENKEIFNLILQFFHIKANIGQIYK